MLLSLSFCIVLGYVLGCCSHHPYAVMLLVVVAVTLMQWRCGLLINCCVHLNRTSGLSTKENNRTIGRKSAFILSSKIVYSLSLYCLKIGQEYDAGIDAENAGQEPVRSLYAPSPCNTPKPRRNVPPFNSFAGFWFEFVVESKFQE